MKKVILVFSVFAPILLNAQVTITTSHLPQPNDVIVTQAATLLQDVDLEDTGQNHDWYFGPDVLQSLPQTTELYCVDVDDTPIAYQFLFNNPFDPEHNSDFAIGIEEFTLGTITVSDAYQYFKNNAQHYAMTGMGVSISGIPIAAVADDVDMIYKLPLEFGDTDNSETEMEFDIPTIGYWGVEQTRAYEVDGWGTLHINNMEIDVIRYRAVINATDSLYSETFGFGFNLPRPETIEYRWISPLYNVPVLQINTSGGIVASVQTAPIFEIVVIEQSSAFVQVFPNPTVSDLRISDIKTAQTARVYNSLGQLVLSEMAYPNEPIDVQSLPPGLYTLILGGESGTTINFTKQ